MEDTTGGLRQATRMALYHGGTQVLREPRRFVGLVSDKLGDSAPEVRVLYHAIDMEYVEGFADAADVGTPMALRDATVRGAAQLEDRLFMRTDVARSTSLAIALAVSDFLGIEAPDMPPGWESGEDRRRDEEETRRKDVQTPSVEFATVSGVDPTYPYTGRPVEPEPRVELGGRALVRDRDYLLTYRDNVGAASGTSRASVTVVGIGGYEGTKSVAFDIVESMDPTKKQVVPPKKKGRLGSWTKSKLALASAVCVVLLLVGLSLAWLNPFGRNNVTAISAGFEHTVGLLGDGTVVATGRNDFGQCDVSGWRGVTAVSAGDDHTVGLLGDGTVVATGRNDFGQCDVSGWRGVTAVSAGLNHTVGVLGDGTVVATGDNHDGECDVSDW